MSQRRYRLEVEGKLDDRFAGALDGLTLRREQRTTVFEGIVRDQAHLDGLLKRVSALGMTLVSLEAQHGKVAARGSLGQDSPG
jgi:hypothetical protein